MFNKRKDAILINKEIPIFNRMIPYMMRKRNVIIKCKPSDTLEVISKNVRDAITVGKTAKQDDQERTLFLKLQEIILVFI